MKIASIAAAFVFVVSATAWDLKVFMQDGRTFKSHGARDSGCVNYDFDMSSPLNRAVFHDSKNGETFELYETKDCKMPVSYRNNMDATLRKTSVR